jgi:uncharacterized protein (DUF3820 family)
MANKLKFGKYSGKTIQEIFEAGDYSYIVWLGEKCSFKAASIGLTLELVEKSKNKLNGRL